MTAAARGQANLLAVGVAVLLVVGAVGGTLALADAAFAGADRTPEARHAAVAAAERLVAPDGPVAVRANVLAAGALARLNATAVTTSVPALRGRPFRVELGDEVLAARGEPVGPTYRRLVAVATPTPRTRTVSAAAGITLPRRTDRIRFNFTDAAVTRVRVGGRVVLARPDELRGTATVAVSRRATLRVTFAGTGDVTVRTFPTRTRKARLEVTVGD